MKNIRCLINVIGFLVAAPIYSSGIGVDHTVFTVGAFQSKQGESQQVNVTTLIGDNYTITQKHDKNVLIGLEGFKTFDNGFDVGLGIFFLPRTHVDGLIYQEGVFDNLSYSYRLSHLPILVSVRKICAINDNHSLVFAGGIGPNFINAYHFIDRSRDNGVTLPNKAFNGNARTTLAGSAAIAWRFNHGFQGKPIDIGYRFFYLGSGYLNPRTNQINTNLKTGNVYANAITISAQFEG